MDQRNAFIFLLCIVIGQAIVCPDHICDRMQCDDDVEDCEGKGGIFKKKGGFCECCDICQIQLGEGELCIPVDFHISPPKEVCSEGLFCDHDTFSCKKKER